MCIRTKLLLGFGLVLATMLALSVFTCLRSMKIEQSADVTTGANSGVYALLAKDMKFHVVQVQQFLTDASVTGDKEVMSEAEEQARAFDLLLAKFRRLYAEKNMDGGMAELDSISVDFHKYHELGDKMALAYIDQGREAGNVLMEQFDSQALTLAGRLDPFVEAQSKNFELVMAGVVTEAKALRTEVIIGTILALVLSLIVIMKLNSAIVRPLSLLTLAANRLAEGHVEVDDILAQL